MGILVDLFLIVGHDGGTMVNRSRAIVLLSFLAIACAPSMASAKLDLYNPNKKYKDEKIAINDPASRCMTTAV